MFLPLRLKSGGDHFNAKWSLILLLMCVIAVNAQQYSYTRDCIDQHHKEVKCFVQLVDCEDDSFLNEFSTNNNQTEQVGKPPDAAHDLRIEPFAKAISRRQSESYQLSVDISWQTAPNNSTKNLKAFFLDIESEDQKTHLCFLFNVSESNWTKESVSASPRLHFSTENLFRFDKKYDVEVHSLPRSAKQPKVIKKEVTMPHNPRVTNFTSLLSPNCSQYSHPFASKWTAGFRRIIHHPLARTIQIEFVGAPAQYCFEQYEVRLLDETGLELLHSDTISVEQMQAEKVGNNTVLYGQYNFTNLDLDKNYIPSVIAVERATDGRCLCPVYGTNPYDSTVVCSCIAADWKPVKLQKLQQGGYVVVNSTVSLAEDKLESNGWGIYLFLVALIMAILSVVAFLLIVAYRHYGARGKTVRIRFIQDRERQGRSNGGNYYDGQGKALLESTAITMGTSMNLLIVYAHDSKEHEAAVLALADFMRDTFGFDVHLDCFDASKIERNLMDYLSASILSADKVLILNSMGAAQRYQTKIQSVPGASFIVEHNEPSLFDSLFVQQIDMALQHHSVVSARFDFSEFNEVLLPLHGCLQYVLPGNLTPLLSALTGSNLKNDPRLLNTSLVQRLQDAIDAQKKMVAENPAWFSQTHHRRRIAARQSIAQGLAQQQVTLLPSMSTLPTLSVGGDEDLEERISMDEEVPLIHDLETIEVDEMEADNDQLIRKTPEMEPKVEIEVVNEKTSPVHEETVPEPKPQISSTTQTSELAPILESAPQQVVYVKPYPVDQDTQDSGVYEDPHMISGDLQDRLHEIPQLMNKKVEDAGCQVAPELLAQTSLSPPNSRIGDMAGKKKWQEDDAMDSGMISDADLHMISAT